jgi:hypothetical protein
VISSLSSLLTHTAVLPPDLVFRQADKDTYNGLKMWQVGEF